MTDIRVWSCATIEPGRTLSEGTKEANGTWGGQSQGGTGPQGGGGSAEGRRIPGKGRRSGRACRGQEGVTEGGVVAQRGAAQRVTGRQEALGRAAPAGGDRPRGGGAAVLVPTGQRELGGVRDSGREGTKFSVSQTWLGDNRWIHSVRGLKGGARGRPKGIGEIPGEGPGRRARSGGGPFRENSWHGSQWGSPCGERVAESVFARRMWWKGRLRSSLSV